MVFELPRLNVRFAAGLSSDVAAIGHPIARAAGLIAAAQAVSCKFYNAKGEVSFSRALI